MTQKLVYVLYRSELADASRLAALDPTIRYIAGSKSIHTQLQERGLEPVNPDAGTTEASSNSALERILDTLDALDTRLNELGHTASARALVAVQLIMALSIHERMASISSRWKGDISVLRSGRIVPLAEYFGVESRSFALPPGTQPAEDGFLPFAPYVNPFSSGYLLEMRARKARSRPKTGMPRFVRLVPRNDKSSLRSLQKNLRIQLRDLFRPGKLSQFVLSSNRPVADRQLLDALTSTTYATTKSGLPSSAVAELTGAVLAEYHTYKRLSEKFVERFGANLKAVAFDSPVIPFQAALAEAANALGIMVTQESHGCIVVHGGGNRERAARILSGGGYTWIPGIHTLIPRSPLQAIGADSDKSIVKINRAAPFSSIAPRDTERPFTILYAPNFLRWHMSVPGLATTCFETLDVATTLASAVANRQDWKLNLRIKVTVSDTPEKRELTVDRGLLPRDIQHLVGLGSNIQDTSSQSYASNLSNADLVVTEGLTAVMIESLEQRIPVLLFNRSSERVPSLPSWRATDLETNGGRNAIYATSIDEDHRSLIGRIAELHKGKPLIDKELAGKCWVDSGTTGSDYLARLLVNKPD